MPGEVIRVPRTTALFINGLGRILRDELGYPVFIEESWTFEHTAQWEECGRKSQCSLHNNTEQCIDHDYEKCQCFMPCYEYRHDVYMGEGFFFATGHRVEVRCRISLTHWDAGGDLIDIELWVQDKDGPVQSKLFSIGFDGRPRAEAEKPTLAFPPNRFAFWKDHPGLKTHRKSRQGYRLERLLRRHRPESWESALLRQRLTPASRG